MKKLTLLFSLFLFSLSCFLNPVSVRAVETPGEGGNCGSPENWHDSEALSLALLITGDYACFPDLSQDAPMNQFKFGAGRSANNQTGFLPVAGHVIANLYHEQPSSREYIADLLDNVGVPSVNRAYAQGTGYKAMSPFLVFWKGFRNLAYSLYIIMFVVVGIMIMLRTKVSAQAVITIQAALPNLLVTLLLITFSYAIVGFMIDLMYFLIYFVVYLISGLGVIQTPLKAIDRLLSYSAWGVLFEGRNSIVSGIAHAVDSLLSGLGTGAVGVAGKVLAALPLAYLFVAIGLAIAMIKLMIALIKSYVMLIVQTVTAPVQLLMNALPGSKAFGNWLKKTASYLIPFPVAAVMFIFSAVLVGDPTQSTIFKDAFGSDANPFGIDSTNEFYTQTNDNIWLPPFTLTGATDLNAHDILIVIGYFIFTMTPAVVKMAQDWMQVKESPYTAEAFANIGVGGQVAAWPVKSTIGAFERQAQYRQQAKIFGNASYRQPGVTQTTATPVGGKEPASPR